jgi:hypothetical protein
VDVAADVERVRREGNCDGLLTECLEGADVAHEDGWRDYVSAVCAAAEQDEVADEDDIMTTITIATATYAQIAQLREEALAYGDLAMARICDIAIHGEIEPSALRVLPRAAQSRLSAMTQGEAAAECDRVICGAAAGVAS